MLSGKGGMVALNASTQFEAYINFINQYRAENQVKNGMNYTGYFTLDINTVFSGNSYASAGTEWVEEITDIMFDKLYLDEKFRLKEFGINNDRFVVTGVKNFSQPMPLQYTADQRVFRSVNVFEVGIHHTKADNQRNLWIKTINDGDF